MIEIRDARLEDVEYLVADMRQEDSDEVEAIGYSRTDGVLIPLRLSTAAWSILKDGRLLGMCGVVPDDAISGHATSWLLSTNAVEQAKLAYHRSVRDLINLVSRDFPVLYNYVDARYRRSIDWLARLGFQSKGSRSINGFEFVKMVRQEA